MKYAIHAGHGSKGKGTVGAIAFLDESAEAREITKRVIDYIKANGDDVVNCTEDCGTANQILASIVKKTNESKADYSISIHFNAGAKKTADGKYYLFDLGSENVGFPEISFNTENECEVYIGWGEHIVDGKCRAAIHSRRFTTEILAKEGFKTVSVEEIK